MRRDDQRGRSEIRHVWNGYDRLSSGPAAASNSLVWLASNGYGRLLPEKPTQQKAQETLITLLAQSDYMAASNGTGVWGITRGLKKYIESKSYKVLKLFYQGWRSAPPEINAAKQLPDIEIIKDAVIGNSKDWHVNPVGTSTQKKYHVTPANYSLRAIVLEAGNHHFVMEYTPKYFHAGIGTSSINLLQPPLIPSPSVHHSHIPTRTCRECLTAHLTGYIA